MLELAAIKQRLAGLSPERLLATRLDAVSSADDTLRVSLEEAVHA